MVFEHLKYFIALVESESYSQVAEDLFISQSTVSKAVKRLEEEFNTKLIDRSAAYFKLTDEGRIFYKYCKEITEGYYKKTAELREALALDPEGIRLGLPPTAGAMYFFKVIKVFEDKYPHIEISIDDSTSRYIVDKVLKDQLDLGVVVEPFDDDRFIKHQVFTSEAVLVVSKDNPLSKEDRIDAGRLEAMDFIQVTKDFMFANIFDDFCKGLGFEPNVVFKSNQWDLVCKMIEEDRGVGVLPKPLIEEFFPDKLKTIRIEDPVFPWALDLIYKKGKRLSRGMEDFIKVSSMKWIHRI